VFIYSCCGSSLYHRKPQITDTVIRINVNDADDNSTVECKNSFADSKISEIKINLSEIETEISEIKSSRKERGLDRLETSLLSEEMIPVALADKEVKHLKRLSG
jgi:uncharacterized phage protein gp47/JayE